MWHCARCNNTNLKYEPQTPNTGRMTCPKCGEATEPFPIRYSMCPRCKKVRVMAIRPGIMVCVVCGWVGEKRPNDYGEPGHV